MGGICFILIVDVVMRCIRWRKMAKVFCLTLLVVHNVFPILLFLKIVSIFSGFVFALQHGDLS